MTEQKYAVGLHPNLPPPKHSVGALHWVRSSFFSSPMNAILTFFSLYLVWLVVPPFLNWAVFSADWLGEDRSSCSREGACWVFIRVWYEQLIYGRYPDEQIWRINLSYILAIAAAAPLFFDAVSRQIKTVLVLFLVVVFPVICFYLYYGGSFGLEMVETSVWGGLFLTLVIAVTGIVMSLPLGILLALGRRSEMPVVMLGRDLPAWPVFAARPFRR